MGLFSRKASGHGYKPGTHWTEPSAYTDDYSIVEKPGYYGLTPDGKSFLQPLVRLVMIDDAPGVEDDGRCHLEVAAPHEPAQMHRGQDLISFQSTVDGNSNVGVQ